MKAKLDFRVDGSGARWMRMSLSGDGWTPGWSVPYANLESWGMLTWFAAPPAEAEGLVSNRDYRMSDTPTRPEFGAFLDNLHTLIGQIKPTIQPSVSFTIADEREYQ